MANHPKGIVAPINHVERETIERIIEESNKTVVKDNVHRTFKINGYVHDINSEGLSDAEIAKALATDIVKKDHEAIDNETLLNKLGKNLKRWKVENKSKVNEIEEVSLDEGKIIIHIKTTYTITLNNYR